MASRELITLNGKARWGFNVSEPVGFAGQNKTGDVLLVQAMFNYIAMGLGQDGIAGAIEDILLPELTGIMDAPTMEALSNFQAKHAKDLYAPDFTIHRASYKNRNINRFKPLMTITLLHVHAIASAKMLSDEDYTIGMYRLIPKLLPWILGTALGTIKQPGMGGLVTGLGRRV